MAKGTGARSRNGAGERRDQREMTYANARLDDERLSGWTTYAIARA
jgi:hypothetical protein